MFGFHWPELLIIVGIATVIFGPRRIPEIGGSLGRTIRSFRQGVDSAEKDTPVSDHHATGEEAGADKG